jgi:hypothetical protein
MRTELFINGTRVDVKKEVGISLTLAIADIKNPDKRNAGFSRTVEIPANGTANKVFSHAFDFTEIQNTSAINFNPDYNPNLKATAVVQVDGVEQFRGYLRMRGIKRENQDLGKITYICELFGDLGNIVTNLGNALLSDLDVSEYDHVYNRTNQKATWTTINPSGGYYYPMIQYGDNDGVNWNVNHFYPALYEKVIFDKVLEYAGYEYESPFISGSRFGSFVVPFTGTSFLLDQASATSRLFNSRISSPYTILDMATWTSIPDPFPFDAELSDPDGQYNPATYTFTCVSAGYYEFKVSGSFFWSAVGGNCVNLGFYALYVTIRHRRGTQILQGYQQGVLNSVSSLNAGNSSNTVSFTYTTPTIQVNAGDEIWVELNPSVLGALTGTGQQYAQFNLSTCNFFNSVSNASIVEGATVPMNSALPNDIKMADYFMSVIKDFNLMIEPDRTNPQKVYIDTATDFYGSGQNRDWSHKLDVSKPVELTPMGGLDAKRYVLQWKDSDDYFNKKYRETWAEGYGMKKHDVTNDFVMNENIYTSVFSPTPMVSDSTTDRIYPHIYTLENGNIRKRIKSGMRRLIATGAVATTYAWNYITASTTYSETTYPQSGHLDSVTSPTFDLNFTNPREIYYTATNYTDGNLWNRYHRKYIEEITDRNSKMLTGYFYLTPLDILRLSFRDQYFIHGQYYRLLKIQDYNTEQNKVTKCEFVLIKNREVFTASTYSLLSYLNNTNGNVDVVPRGDGGNSGANNAFVGERIQINGGIGNAVFGYNISLGSEASRNFVAASSGVVIEPDVIGAVVIRSDDVTVTRSGEVWIDGNKYTFGSRNVYFITANATITEAGTYYCSGLLTLTLDSTVLTVNDRIQVFNMTGSTVTVAGGGLNIVYSNNNSVATFNLNHKYESLTLTYTGSQYIVT